MCTSLWTELRVRKFTLLDKAIKAVSDIDGSSKWLRGSFLWPLLRPRNGGRGGVGRQGPPGSRHWPAVRTAPGPNRRFGPCLRRERRTPAPQANSLSCTVDRWRSAPDGIGKRTWSQRYWRAEWQPWQLWTKSKSSDPRRYLHAFPHYLRSSKRVEWIRPFPEWSQSWLNICKIGLRWSWTGSDRLVRPRTPIVNTSLKCRQCK